VFGQVKLSLRAVDKMERDLWHAAVFIHRFVGNAPVLVWAPYHTLPLKFAMLESLVRHLDSMYFVDTFEHDFAANPR
jgi:hypothetical protein